MLFERFKNLQRDAKRISSYIDWRLVYTFPRCCTYLTLGIFFNKYWIIEKRFTWETLLDLKYLYWRWWFEVYWQDIFVVLVTSLSHKNSMRQILVFSVSSNLTFVYSYHSMTLTCYMKLKTSLFRYSKPKLTSENLFKMQKIPKNLLNILRWNLWSLGCKMNF